MLTGYSWVLYSVLKSYFAIIAPSPADFRRLRVRGGANSDFCRQSGLGDMLVWMVHTRGTEEGIFIEGTTGFHFT